MSTSNTKTQFQAKTQHSQSKSNQNWFDLTLNLRLNLQDVSQTLFVDEKIPSISSSNIFMTGSDSKQAGEDPPSLTGVEFPIQVCPLISPCVRMSQRAHLLTRSQTSYEFQKSYTDSQTPCQNGNCYTNCHGYTMTVKYCKMPTRTVKYLYAHDAHDALAELSNTCMLNHNKLAKYLYPTYVLA